MVGCSASASLSSTAGVTARELVRPYLLTGNVRPTGVVTSCLLEPAYTGPKEQQSGTKY